MCYYIDKVTATSNYTPAVWQLFPGNISWCSWRRLKHIEAHLVTGKVKYIERHMYNDAVAVYH